MLSGKLVLCFHSERPENSQTTLCIDSSGRTAGEKQPTNVPLWMFCCSFTLAQRLGKRTQKKGAIWSDAFLVILCVTQVPNLHPRKMPISYMEELCMVLSPGAFPRANRALWDNSRCFYSCLKALQAWTSFFPINSRGYFKTKALTPPPGPHCQV